MRAILGGMVGGAIVKNPVSADAVNPTGKITATQLGFAA
jgi:hypothetical protein